MKSIERTRLSRCATVLLACGVTLPMVKADAGSVTYKYDNAGRLRASVYSDASSVAYNLDPAGNRKAVTILGPDTTAPSPPGSFTASAGASNAVSLSWTASTDNAGGSGLAGYYIYRWSPPGSSSHPQIAKVPATTTTYNDTGLSGSTAYSYGVAAYDLAGNVSTQSVTSVTTPAAPPPSVPTGLSATALSATQVSLAWNASSDSWGPGIGGYVVYRNGTAITTTAANSTSYVDTGLSMGATYSYTVAARDTLGYTSAQSGAVSVTTPQNYTDSAVITEGSASGYAEVLYGYLGAGVAGSISPTTLSGGKTVASFYDTNYPTSQLASVNISGFNSDPGQYWLVSASAFGVTKTGATASYSYSNGTATWNWLSDFGFLYSGTVTVTIVHGQ